MEEEFLRPPEYYTDSVNFMTNIYGFTLEFGAIQAQDAPPKVFAVERERDG